MKEEWGEDHTQACFPFSHLASLGVADPVFLTTEGEGLLNR